VVHIVPPLGQDFYQQPFASMFTGFKIVSAEVSGSGFVLVLDNRVAWRTSGWQVRFVLDGNYQIVSHQRLP
jgi:hypothetical protein